ncbi:polysaccharide lyase [Rubellicoccus peritrichatus]|uniref:Polysaccharide lyase 14 domain-containing protein n=1 Tax=Rubellicoccus peritrichatus TaxID=3080537 RepID=A0AAQ3L900_9BACT|nr:hypothetical protein [Puniceicoccus sp. CR14]WOO41555.1 hypothetical protein RZN69_00540 [Puniceicoccus sp. CR14]
MRKCLLFLLATNLMMLTVHSVTYNIRDVWFNNWAPWSYYTANEVAVDFGNYYSYVSPTNKIQINNVGQLRFHMPQGKVGIFETGGSFLSRLTPKNAFNLEYRVKFDGGGGRDYDWTRGGKLPGLGGGVVYSGGNPATAGDGFSVRLQFSDGGSTGVPGQGYISPYVYYKDQPNQYGDGFGQYIPIADNVWNTIKVYVKVNTGSNANGVLAIYLNGALVFYKSDLRYVTNGTKVDMLYFSCFHGGTGAAWTPSQNQDVLFDNVMIRGF